MERVLRLTGVTNADRSVFVSAPYLRGRRAVGLGHFNLYLRELARGGSRVRKGEVVALFDRQYMLVRQDDYRAMLRDHQVNHLRRLKVQLNLSRKAYEQRIRAARGVLDKARLDLKTAPVRSAIETERMRLLAAEAEAAYTELLKDSDFVDISESSAIRRSELDLREAEIETRRAEQNVEKMVVRAPMSGLVVLQSIFQAGEVREIQIGDQLHTGHVFLQIVDLDSMVVNARVNQVDAGLLRLGAPARVRFDAYPDLELPATLKSVGTLAKGHGARASYITQVPVRLKLEKLDRRVVPNLSASADIILARAQDQLLVPRECVFGEGESQVAFVSAPSGWEERTVHLGMGDYTTVAVISGLREGETVAAEQPSRGGQEDSSRLGF